MNGPELSDREREIENLRAVYRSLHEPPAAPAPSAQTPGHPGHHAGRRTALGGIAAALALLASKLKFLGILGSVLKFKTLATMALSVGLYATQWGWPFALGFVLLIFVHELGHAIVLHHEGIPAGAPVFIPFVGAVIAMRGQPRDAGVEAAVAIGGPVLGSLGAWAVLVAGMYLRQPLLAALGHVGIMLNLFNLIPVPPLDGGRIAGAFSKPFWIVGYALGIVALIVTRSPILFLALLLGLWTLVQRWRHPVAGYDRIGRPRRFAIAFG
ncbi:MAG TPA: site-2 protease family protein, partial [Dongiaceae bacterium]|nr:site-2 protease family protein [Dongiaceae bacterium]